MRLTARLPDVGATFVPERFRELVKRIEELFYMVQVDTTIGAYPVTGDHTFSDNDEVVLFDTSGGSLTATLPLISTQMVKDKREFEAVKLSAANTLTVVTTGADTLLGATGVTIDTQYDALRMRATGSGWVAI